MILSGTITVFTLFKVFVLPLKKNRQTSFIREKSLTERNFALNYLNKKYYLTVDSNSSSICFNISLCCFFLYNDQYNHLELRSFKRKMRKKKVLEKPTASGSEEIKFFCSNNMVSVSRPSVVNFFYNLAGFCIRQYEFPFFCAALFHIHSRAGSFVNVKGTNLSE